MIPTRLRAQYILFRLYVENDDPIEALKIAQTIVAAEPKVINTQTIKMQVEAKQYINRIENPDNHIVE